MIKTVLKAYAIDRVVSSILDSMIATFQPSSEPNMGLMVGMYVLVSYTDYDGEQAMVCGQVLRLYDEDGDLELNLDMNDYSEDLWWVCYSDIVKWELLEDVMGRLPVLFNPNSWVDTNCGVDD